MSEDLNQAVDKPRRWIAVAIMVGVGAIALEVLTAVTTYYAFGTWSDRGNFGQMFGAVSALFSAFALAAVAISIVLQSDELSLQRQELVFSRRELQRSADAQVATVELFRKQLAATQVSLDEERRRRRQVSAPIFKFVEAPAGPQPIMKLKLINEGAAIRELIIRSKARTKSSLGRQTFCNLVTSCLSQLDTKTSRQPSNLNFHAWTLQVNPGTFS